MDRSGGPGLERSCGAAPEDWLRPAPSQAGLERIEAFFAGHAFDPHRHDTYAIGITLDGLQCFAYRGARADSRAGNLIVLHPDEIHDGRAGAAAGFRYRMAYVEPRLVRAALGRSARSLPFVRSPVSTDPRLARALRLALADLDRPLEELEADRFVVALADALLALDPSAAGRPLPPSCALAVDRARQFLDAHHDRAVASAELEAITGLDRFALARHFRARLGTSPYRYLVMRRLDQARSLMRAGHSVADAAQACGFADQSHLTRQFHNAYGLPPGRWRAIHLAAPAALAPGLSAPPAASRRRAAGRPAASGQPSR
jgi:AraC-like DNA-binding protein